MASITLLPGELLDQICDLLDGKDLCSLRLACKPLCSRTYHYLAPAFREIYLALTSDGLQFLKDLAGHKVLRGYVMAFWIIPSLFDAHYDWNIDQFCRVRDQHKPSTQGQTSPKRVKIRRTIAQLTAGDHPNKPKASPANEELYRVYQGVVLDHLQIILAPLVRGCPATTDMPKANDSGTRTLLLETLATCLPSFPGLRNVGIRRYADHSASTITARGIYRLRSQLQFNPVASWPPLNRPGFPQPDWGRSFKVDIFDMSAFTALIAAIEEAGIGIKIEALETGALIADTGDQQQVASLSLQPILSHLRRLSVIIASSHIETRIRERIQQEEDKLLPLTREYTAWNARSTGDRHLDQQNDRQQQRKLLQRLAATAPVLEDLTISLPITSRLPNHDHRHALTSWISGLDLTDSHFDWMAHNFRFAALHTLSLDNMAIAVSSFTTFLQTAQPTLRRLSIWRVHWTNGPVVEWSRAEKGEIVKEAERVCRLICLHLRDCFSLESLVLEEWFYRASPIHVIDPDYRRACRSSARSCTTTDRFMPVQYGRERTISFKAWLYQLKFIAGDGREYIRAR
ncbi:hypothetical protein BDV12DRAFT_195075 [Aspergillus spectabilis]